MPMAFFGDPVYDPHSVFRMERLPEQALELISEFVGDPAYDPHLDEWPQWRYRRAWEEIWAWTGANRFLQNYYREMWRFYLTGRKD